MKANILNDVLMYSGSTGLESLITSMEDGETQVEREYEIYGTVEDLKILKGLAERIEYQEQWGLPSDRGNIRVRRTQVGDDITFTMTIKSKKKDGNLETEMEVSEDTFVAFKSIVPDGLVKTRYVIPVKDSELKLEVDVFTGDEGVCKVVKIDLEVAEGQEIDSIDIPFKLVDPRVIVPGKKSDEDLAFVRELFSTRYNVVNHRQKTED